MCGRFYIADDDDSEELMAIIDEINRRGAPPAFKPSGEIFPTDIVPIVANNRAGRRSAFAMKWGYTLPGKRLIINSRSETAAHSPLFGDGMAAHRCLIPATNYFEWERQGRARQKYAIRTARPLMYMAGIYRMEGDAPVFSILTRSPADSISFIHDRMPVILGGEARDMWLDISTQPQAALCAAEQNVQFEPVGGV